jgi:hypothetical protein
MQPPWVAHPEIPFMSIGWRMGYGEEYWDEFDRWYKALPPARRDQYTCDNPAPSSWPGFYEVKRALLDSRRDSSSD